MKLTEVLKELKAEKEAALKDMGMFSQDFRDGLTYAYNDAIEMLESLDGKYFDFDAGE